MYHRLILVVLSLLASLGACAPSTSEAPVQTDRKVVRNLIAPKEDIVFQFVVYGDRTGGPAEGIEVLRQAVAETNLIDPDLVMTVGDLIQGYNQQEAWLGQMREYREVMDRLTMPWYPVAGNHDIYWRGEGTPQGHHEANYESHFGPLWYWFAHKNSAFIVLYTDEGDAHSNQKSLYDPAHTQMSERQLAWLQGALQETKRFDRVFVFMHHPRWLGDIYKDNNWSKAHDLLKAPGNVSAVFAGHVHRQRFSGEEDGIRYYALATVGGGMPMDVPGSGWANHMELVTVRRDDYEIASLPVGAAYDPEALTPAYLADLDQVRLAELALVSDPVVLAQNGGLEGQLIYRWENRSAAAVDLTLTISAPQGGGWSYQPDAHRIQVPPGESVELPFELNRPADDFDGLFSVPRVELQLTYDGAAGPVELPVRRQQVALEPEQGDAISDQEDTVSALHLLGDGSGVWLPAHQALPTQGPFTMESWFRADAPETNRVLFNKGGERGFFVAIIDRRPQIVIWLGGRHYRLRAHKDWSLAEGQWHHFAVDFDGEMVRLYLDGALQAEQPAKPGLGVSTAPFYWGAQVNGVGEPNAPFVGALDEARFSLIARYAGAPFVPARRLQSDAYTHFLYRFDRTEGPFVWDSGPAQRHGIASGDMRFDQIN